MDIVGARWGEIFFARTSVVRRRVAGATSWGVAMFDGWAIAHQSRTCGRKIFRPYTCGEWLHRVGATIYGAAMFDDWVNGYCWRTYGRNIFRPYIGDAGANLACATICGAVMVGRWRMNGARAGEKYFAPTNAACC